MSTPRVLLVEDDASVRRFVCLAWEDEGVEIVEAASVAQALQALQRGPYVLLLTDLMLPDGNGMQVLQALAQQPALRGGARLAVFSAGLTSQRHQQLKALGVDEIIAKPAPLAQLLGCLRSALDAPATQPSPADAAQSAAERYFAGDVGLYEEYRASCLRQFELDRRQGDAAVAAADLGALRRLAHSLKTVLQTLGCDATSALARRVERDAAEGRSDAAVQGWAELAAALAALKPR